MKKKKKTKARKRIENILLVICILIALVCFGIVIYKLSTYYKEDKENKKLAEEYSFILDVPDKPKKNNGEPGSSTEDPESGSKASEDEDEADKSYDTIGIDYASLLEKNKDYVGWIRMANGINYPIVRGKDTTEYLHLNFNRKYAYSGSIMMESSNAPDYSSPNTVLYGHNMRDGSMFAMNHKYKSKEYAEENPYFFVHIQNGYFTYKIVACIVTQDGSEGYSLGLDNKEYFDSYKKFVESKALYTTEELELGDRYMTLSTCTGRVGGTTRLLVVGRLQSFTTYQGIRVSGHYYFGTKPEGELYNPFITEEIIYGTTDRDDG